jgi:hypothetical protein
MQRSAETADRELGWYGVDSLKYKTLYYGAGLKR